MKNIITICLILYSSVLAAQSFPRSSTIHTPYGRTTITTFEHRPMVYHNGSSVSAIPVKHNYFIILKSDSILSEKTKIKNSAKPESLTVKVGKKKREIKPSDTKEIFFDMYDGRRVTGFQADSCWLFKVFTGKITGYSDMPEEGYDFTLAIQDSLGSPIIPCTLENVKAMIGETTDRELLRYLEKGKIKLALQRYNKLVVNKY